MTEGAAVETRTERELRLLHGLTQRALGMERLNEFWPVLEPALVSYFGCDRATLYLVEKAELRSMFAKGLADSVVVRLGDGVAGIVALTRRAVLVNDPRSDPRFNPQYDQLSGYRTESLACASFQHEGQALGVVELLNKPGGFEPEDLAALEDLSRHVGFIIAALLAEEHNRRLREHLSRAGARAALGLMLGGVARDLGAPLSELDAAADRILSSLRPDSPEIEAFESLKAQMLQCRSIAATLRGYSSLSEFALTKVRADKALQAVLDVTEHTARLQKVKRLVEVPAELPEVKAGEDALRQVFLTLTDNALQALRSGGTLRITAAAADGKVRFVFEDDGDGIDPMDLGRLFEPFFTTRPESDASGLGLSLSKNLLERCGGTIEARSEGRGRGAVFTVELPLYSPRA